MIRVQQLKLPCQHARDALTTQAAKRLHIKEEQIAELIVRKRSIDARKKPDIFLSYVVDVRLASGNEKKLAARLRDRDITVASQEVYHFPSPGRLIQEERPVIAGMGPAGLFCGYLLAEHGYRPVLIERGKDVDRRTEDVHHFWETGQLNTESNVAFGEGGAGTFSDGKLNTLIKDKSGRSRRVLEIFVENGAQPEILYDAKPHIGSDVLTKVVKSMRQKILDWGGEVRFETRLDGIRTQQDRVTGASLSDGSFLPASCLVLAVGHSARDTFQMLSDKGVPMEAKAFAIGLRAEHPQSLINRAQYGPEQPGGLPPAVYKVTAKTKSGRGVYSFCMCPGGYVVNASSEDGHLAVNGMSYSGRDSLNANSAIIVSVTPEDFGNDGPLAGVHFQRELERKAFLLGNGKIPVQRYKDFSGTGCRGYIPEGFTPCNKGAFCEADLSALLPAEVKEAFLEGMEQFGTVIPGFDDENVLLSAIESRTSSPVRIMRDETLQSVMLAGLYPCGEGAGYAGGIMSAAMDGMRVAETIAGLYRPVMQPRSFVYERREFQENGPVQGAYQR